MHRKPSLVSRPELACVYGRAWNVGARGYEQESVGIEQQQCGTWGGNKQASAFGGARGGFYMAALVSLGPEKRESRHVIDY